MTQHASCSGLWYAVKWSPEKRTSKASSSASKCENNYIYRKYHTNFPPYSVRINRDPSCSLLMVIFSNRHLDSHSINFNTLGFLAVNWHMNIILQRRYQSSTLLSIRHRGGSRIFIGGGGGVQKIMCVHTHHEREARSLLRLGSRLIALEALGCIDALSCYLSHLFTYS